MKLDQRSYRTAGGIGVIVIGAMFATFAFAQAAPTSSPSNVTFPVPELGNCADATACHAYCNIPANMEACTTFAENHGLETAAAATQANQFAKILRNGGGPGGCDSPDSCDAYCSSIDHLKACMAFAKANNIVNDKMAQGQKILSYLESGGHMPGNCSGQSACETYCSDQTHMAECAKFAEDVGLPQGGGPGSNGAASPEQEQKFQAVLRAGNNPGGCATLSACLVYCSDPSHGSACGAFGAAMGVEGSMKVTQAGPGGCASDATCKAYCGDPAHAAECQQFSHQSNYVQGTSSSFGMPGGTACGQNQYWNGSECASSGPVCQPGTACTPPPCPAGQICNSDTQSSPSTTTQSLRSTPSYQANLTSIFGVFVQDLLRILTRR